MAELLLLVTELAKLRCGIFGYLLFALFIRSTNVISCWLVNSVLIHSFPHSCTCIMESTGWIVQGIAETFDDLDEQGGGLALFVAGP